MAVTFTATPRVYPAPVSSKAIAFEQAFFKQAGQLGCNLGILGDSQEIVNGEGRAYCPRFHQRLAERFGTLGATGWSALGSAVQAAPFIRGAGGAAGPPTGYSTSDFPPAFDWPLKATNANGIFMCLQPDMVGVVNQAGVTTEAQFQPPRDLIDLASGDLWVCDMLFATKGYTSEATFSDSITWEIRKHTGSVPNASGTLVATATPTGLGFNVGTKSIVKVTTSSFTLDPSNKYTTLCLYSANANPVLPIAMRFRNITRPQGVHPTWISAGGATTATVQTSSAACGPVLKAMELDAIAVAYGANDAYSGGGFSAAVFKANLQSLIAFVRSAAQKSLPVVCFGDCWRTEGTAPQAAEYDQYAGSHAEMADADPLVRACNTRLVTEKLGWTKSNEDIGGLTGGSEWAVTTSYTTSNYVVVTGARPEWYKCILNHTSAAADKPMTGANWRTYWKRCVVHLRAATDLVHHSWMGGCLKADVDVELMMSGYNPDVGASDRIPRGRAVN